MIEKEYRSDKLQAWRKPEPFTYRERRNEHRRFGRGPGAVEKILTTKHAKYTKKELIGRAAGGPV